MSHAVQRTRRAVSKIGALARGAVWCGNGAHVRTSTDSAPAGVAGGYHSAILGANMAWHFGTYLCYVVSMSTLTLRPTVPAGGCRSTKPRFA